MRIKEEKVLKAKINAKGMQISVVLDGSYDDYISSTDIAKYKSVDPAATIQNWMRSCDVIEFLGFWETLYNLDFKPLEFEGVRCGLAPMHLLYLRNVGWKQQLQSVCIPNLPNVTTALKAYNLYFALATEIKSHITLP